MGDISAFVGNISQQRLAKKNRYKIKVSGPGGDALPALTMMCESISFPGQNVRSVPDTLRYGPAREHAQGMTYGPFTATFICSSDLAEKVYFEDWQAQIVNQNSWSIKYYDSYKGSLEVSQLDANNNPTYTIKIYEAYPKTIMPQDVGYAQVNAYQTIGVEFTYRYWAPAELPESGNDVPESDYGTMEADWDPNTGTTRKKGTQGQGGVSMAIPYGNESYGAYWDRVRERRRNRLNAPAVEARRKEARRERRRQIRAKHAST